MISNILIIGGNGFLGYNLANFLISKGFNLDLICKKSKKNFKKIEKVKYIYCNILDKKKIKTKLNKKNYDIIINLVGNINHKNKVETYNVHYKGFKNIINSLIEKKIKLFIQAGSSLEYGKNFSPQKEKNLCNPISYYGKSKYLASRHLIDKKFFKYIILRLYQVYGPYQKINRLIPYVINKCLKNKRFKCTEGKQKRDFLYIEDFNSLILKIIRTKNIKSGIYNVGCGKPIILKNLINKIQKTIKKGKPLYGGIKMRDDEDMLLYPNISKIIRDFNWKPKISLSLGLKKTIKFYKKYSK